MHPTSFSLRPALALFLLAFGGVAFAAGRRVTVRLNGAAQVNLAEGVAQRIGQLLIDGKIAEAGTWGASGSDAEHKDDLHFAGLGVLEVVGKGMTVIVR